MNNDNLTAEIKKIVVGWLRGINFQDKLTSLELARLEE